MKELIITLKRIFKGDNYTIGKLYLNDKYFCDTLEDKERDPQKEKKIPGKTAIPSGEYKVVLSMSNRFKRVLPEILNVPHFTGVRIHRGNTEKDTEGCPLVGENKVKGQVINSRKWEIALLEEMQKFKSYKIIIA